MSSGHHAEYTGSPISNLGLSFVFSPDEERRGRRVVVGVFLCWMEELVFCCLGAASCLLSFSARGRSSSFSASPCLDGTATNLVGVLGTRLARVDLRRSSMATSETPASSRTTTTHDCTTGWGGVTRYLGAACEQVKFRDGRQGATTNEIVR